MRYLLICNTCGNKIFTDGDNVNNLTELHIAPLPKNADGSKNTLDLPRRFKCNLCGYIFHIIQLETELPQSEQHQESEDEDYAEKWSKEVLKSFRRKN